MNSIFFNSMQVCALVSIVKICMDKVMRTRHAIGFYLFWFLFIEKYLKDLKDVMLLGNWSFTEFLLN